MVEIATPFARVCVSNISAGMTHAIAISRTKRKLRGIRTEGATAC